MLPKEPTPEDLLDETWQAWSDEQRYIYLERRGMGADHPTALREAALAHRPQKDC